MGKKIARQIGEDNSFKYIYGAYYGVFNGYDVIIKYDVASLLYNAYLNVNGKLNIDKLNNLLAKIDQYAIAKYKDNKLTITQACDRSKDMVVLVNKVLKEVTEFLKKNKCHNVCKNCNKENYTSLVSIDGNIKYYCDDCYKKTFEKYEQEIKEKRKIKENIFSGILGAILGCLPGLILWCLLAYLMINPSVIALVIMFGSAYGYKAFARSMKLPGLIISLLVGVLFVIFANNLSSAYNLYTEYINQYNINIFDTYRALPYYFNHSEIYRNVYGQNLLLTLMFALFGSFTNFGIYRGYLANNKIKKVVIR